MSLVVDNNDKVDIGISQWPQSPTLHLSIGAGTRTPSSCLDPVQVIEYSTDVVMM